MSEAGRKVLDQVAANKANPGGKTYHAGSMRQSHRLECLVERRFTLMTAAEFAKKFQVKPSGKLPKTPQVKLRGLDGQLEVFYVFKEDSETQRTLVVRSSEGEQLETEMMSPESHLHEEQGERMLDMRHNTRMAESNVRKLLESHAAATLSTVDDYQARTCRHVNTP